MAGCLAPANPSGREQKKRRVETTEDSGERSERDIKLFDEMSKIIDKISKNRRRKITEIDNRFFENKNVPVSKILMKKGMKCQ